MHGVVRDEFGSHSEVKVDRSAQSSNIPDTPISGKNKLIILKNNSPARELVLY